jgi:carboxyl-terminal processing protease
MDIQMDNKPALDPLNKVAVLISRYTISSGEFVANAFKGRKNTRFFGETTGGLTTNTNWVVIGKELIMSISSGVYCDKKGNMYSKNIPEDQPVEFDAENALEKDKGVQAAISWLQEK